MATSQLLRSIASLYPPFMEKDSWLIGVPLLEIPRRVKRPEYKEASGGEVNSEMSIL